MENRMKKQCTVPMSRCDDTGKLSIVGALSEFMDLATEHAERIGVGFQAMSDKHLFWLTVRSRIRFLERPSMLQDVELETWPGAMETMRCQRYYTIKRGGTLLAEAKTQWAVWNYVDNRPAPVGGVFPQSLVIAEETACDGAFASFSQKLGPEEEIGTYTVRSVDIDLGGHMNNVAYASMLLGTLPAARLHDKREMELCYRRPCLEGETLAIRCRETQDALDFAVVKPGGEIAAFARLK